MQQLTLDEFSINKREKLLDYKTYAENYFEQLGAIEVVSRQLKMPSSDLADIPLDAFIDATRGLAWESIDLLANMYSAGHSLESMREFFPTVVQCWETYVHYHKKFHQSAEGSNSEVATIALQGHGFDQANRLVSFAVLLGWTDFIDRLISLVDYNNPVRDGMIERLIAPFVKYRGVAPDECTRHLPYFKVLAIFNASPHQRSSAMSKYLADWYHASRREPYYDSHKRGVAFLGYWSWEAAAITVLLDIDDTSYRNSQFYPHDLVEFARHLGEQGTSASITSERTCA